MITATTTVYVTYVTLLIIKAKMLSI